MTDLTPPETSYDFVYIKQDSQSQVQHDEARIPLRIKRERERVSKFVEQATVNTLTS